MIDHFRIEIRPTDRLYPNKNLFRDLEVEIRTNGMVHTFREILRPEDHQSMLDVYFDYAKRELKKALEMSK